MAYQDRWLRGAVVEPGDRTCADRYAAIAAIAREYTRPITVLDLGANLGYFGCRLAAECNAVAVMIDRRPALFDAVTANGIPRTIVLEHRLTVGTLSDLADCEHFDLVLALNVVHHFADWRGALAAVARLGDELILETPTADDRGACRHASCGPILEAVSAWRPERIGWFQSHVTRGVARPMFRITNAKRHLTCGYLRGVPMPPPPRVRPHVITATRRDKWIAYEDGEVRSWVPGINVWTWSRLGGVRPDLATIQAGVRAVSDEHPDLRPWNFVTDGERVTAIDTEHRRSRGGPAHLEATLAAIAHPDRVVA